MAVGGCLFHGSHHKTNPLLDLAPPDHERLLQPNTLSWCHTHISSPMLISWLNGPPPEQGEMGVKNTNYRPCPCLVAALTDSHHN